MTTHHLADNSHYNHQQTTADPAARDPADNRADSQIATGCAGRRCSAAEDRCEYLSADAATDDSRKRIPQRAKVVLLHHAASDVTAYGSGDKVYDEGDQIHSFSLLVAGPIATTQMTSMMQKDC